MEDVLKRMLEVEAQGEAVVKDAEAKAQALREEMQSKIAAEKEKFEAELRRQYDELVDGEVASQQEVASRELASREVEEKARCAEFAGKIAVAEDEIFKSLAFAE